MSMKSMIIALMILMGGLQARDSNVFKAGLPIILLVSTAIVTPAMLFLRSTQPFYLVGSILLSLALLVVARTISPISLSGVFLVLLPAGLGLIYFGLLGNKIQAN